MKPCPFCGSSVFSAWARSPNLFLNCKGCDVVIRSDALTRGAAETDYHLQMASLNRHDGETPIALLRGFSALVARAALPGGAILDYGTGTGSLVRILQESGFQACGVDPSPTARAAALDQHGLYIEESLDHLPPLEWSAGTAIEVIEHILDLEWLRRIFFLLRPGAPIFVTTPNRESLAALLHRRQWAQLKNPFHVALFNSRALGNALQSAGFVRATPLRRGPVLGRNRAFAWGHQALLFANRHSVLRMVAFKPTYPKR